MSDPTPISELDPGGTPLPTDQLVINRPTDLSQDPAGTNYRIDIEDLPSGSGLSPADPASITVDTTTYDDTIEGSGKLATLLFPAGLFAALAIAQEGDAFPRFILSSDPTANPFFLSDGTVDPASSGLNFGQVTNNGDGTFSLSIDATHGTSTMGALVAPNEYLNVFGGAVSRFAGLQPGRLTRNGTATGGNTVLSSDGDPNSNYTDGDNDLFNVSQPGALNDLFIRSDSPQAGNDWLYRCETAGAPGDAVWAGVV